MPINVKAGGSWRAANKIYARIAGAWIVADQVWGYASGGWRSAWRNEIRYINTANRTGASIFGTQLEVNEKKNYMESEIQLNLYWKDESLSWVPNQFGNISMVNIYLILHLHEPVCLSVSLFVCLSVSLFVCLSVCLAKIGRIRFFGFFF